MQEIPGGSCDHSERGGHGHDGGSDSAGEAERDSSADDDTCDDCGAPYEWRLDIDGVQHYDCPNRDAD